MKYQAPCDTHAHTHDDGTELDVRSWACGFPPRGKIIDVKSSITLSTVRPFVLVMGWRGVFERPAFDRVQCDPVSEPDNQCIWLEDIHSALAIVCGKHGRNLTFGKRFAAHRLPPHAGVDDDHEQTPPPEVQPQANV